MWRFMLDTDTPLQLTFSTGIVATYADLATPQLEAHLLQLHGQVVWIDRGLGDPMHVATVYDVEQRAGDATHAPVWYDARRAAGAQNLTVYANRSTMPSVGTEMGSRPFSRWVARLDGIATVPGWTPGEGPAAVQILGAGALGVHADLSVIYHPGWNAAPAPTNLAGALADIKSAQAALVKAQAILAGAQ